MTELGQGPNEVYDAGTNNLLVLASEYYGALENQQSAAELLRRAEAATDHAKRSAMGYAAALLEKIHDSVNVGTDPGDYLRAVLNAKNLGKPDGDEAVAGLTPMRGELSQGDVHVGIVSSDRGILHFGRSAGDIIVRPPKKGETGIGTDCGVGLWLPMTHTIGAVGGPYSDSRLEYYGKPSEVGVVQRLGGLRVLGTADEVFEASKTPKPPYSRLDEAAQYERGIQHATGFPPLIAYGETAVRALLTSLHKGDARGPGLNDILAAAISLGIAPESVAEFDLDKLRTRFIKDVASGVKSAIIHRALNGPESALGQSEIGWPVTASPQVMRYLGIGIGGITDAVNEGILQSTRYGNLLRLKETEGWVRTAAVGLVAVRYGLEIDPSQLTEIPVRKPVQFVRVSTVVEGFEGGYVRMRGGRGRQPVGPPNEQDDDLNP